MSLAHWLGDECERLRDQVEHQQEVIAALRERVVTAEEARSVKEAPVTAALIRARADRDRFDQALEDIRAIVDETFESDSGPIGWPARQLVRIAQIMVDARAEPAPTGQETDA